MPFIEVYTATTCLIIIPTGITKVGKGTVKLGKTFNECGQCHSYYFILLRRETMSPYGCHMQVTGVCRFLIKKICHVGI